MQPAVPLLPTAWSSGGWTTEFAYPPKGYVAPAGCLVPRREVGYTDLPAKDAPLG